MFAFWSKHMLTSRWLLSNNYDVFMIDQCQQLSLLAYLLYGLCMYVGDDKSGDGGADEFASITESELADGDVHTLSSDDEG